MRHDGHVDRRRTARSGGQRWAHLLYLLRAGGRYVCSGAIARIGRTLYLRDLTLIGRSRTKAENVVSYIERGEVPKTYPLANIVTTQTDFLAKQFTGKLVLLPP